MDAVARRTPRFDFLCDAPDPSCARALFGWRLIAANNRPLARAVRAEITLSDCRAAAAAVRELVLTDPAAVTVDVVRGQCSWRVRDADRDLAVGVHTYFRRIECIRGLTQFLAAVERADPDRGVVRHFGAHSLRTFAAPGPERVTAPRAVIDTAEALRAAAVTP